MKESKDSAEVAKFLALLAKLKEFCDDDPEHLAKLTATDESARVLCGELGAVVTVLREGERCHPELFTAPVAPGFLEAWRDFDERFHDAVAAAWLADVFFEFDFGAPSPSKLSKADLRWESADDDASDHAKAFQGAIDFAEISMDEDQSQYFAEEYVEEVRGGIAAWSKLKHNTGFDLRGVFRRRELVPFVLVPRHISQKLGNAEKLSIFKNLKQAHDAFIYGAPYAALALMRSILEAILRDFYRAPGNDLNERIDNVRALPAGASVAALHRLRRVANAVLHLNLEQDAGISEMDEAKLEKEIVSLLVVLRSLIERAPR